MKLTEKELYAQLDELIARYPILKGVGGDIIASYLILQNIYENGGKRRSCVYFKQQCD